MNKNSIVTAANNQVSANMSDQAVILNTEIGEYYGLNEVGTRIWEIIQHPTSIEQIVTLLVQEYEVEPNQCETEVKTLLQTLLDKGLIEVVGE